MRNSGGLGRSNILIKICIKVHAQLVEHQNVLSWTAEAMSNREHDYTVKIAERALESIKTLGVPADPSGFELWYTYATGRDEKLNRRINRLIEDKGRLTVDDQDKICDEFLQTTRVESAVEEAGSKVSHEVDNVVKLLGELILSTARGRGDVADAKSQLANSRDEEAVRAISDALINSLRAIELHHTALEERLIASKREIEAAQQALATATAEANLDVVTGLATRRRFNSMLEQATEASNNSGEPLSLLMIDIDHFKKFNDRFGHLMGDSVLRLIGVTLKQSIKGQDTAARYGGEEFAVILPQTSLEGAAELAEQIRRRIIGRELKQRFTGESLGGITVSIGIATYRRGERPLTMIDRADAGLYQAKRAGRNCIRTEDAVA